MSFGPGFISGGIGGNDQYTKVMLHLNGTNGSTSFPDVNASGLSNTWSVITTASITTANYKFDGAALTASSFGIQTPAKAALNVGTQDFAIDFWLNMNGAPLGYSGLVGYGNSTINETQWSWYLENVSGKLGIGLSNGSSQTWTQAGITTINTTGWYHIAMTRDAGTVRAFVNGILQYTLSWNQNMPGNVGALKVGGANSSPTGSNILFDEVRYSIGTSRWTSNFTPPNQPYN